MIARGGLDANGPIPLDKTENARRHVEQIFGADHSRVREPHRDVASPYRRGLDSGRQDEEEPYDGLRFPSDGMKQAWGVAFLILLLPASLAAERPPSPVDLRLTQFGLPTGAGADWRQWDSFLTNVVKRLGQDLAEPRREQLRDLFLDSRYQLVQTLSSGTSSDPVPGLLLDTWKRLGPILTRALPELPQQTASQYKAFISTMDGMAALGGLSQELGFLRVTPDALRSASTLLGTHVADPLAYTLDVDSGLRALLGFPGVLPAPQVSPAVEPEHSRLPGQRGDSKASAGWRSWFLTPAFAAEDEFGRLNQWVPETPELSGYLVEVRKLLTQASDGALAKSQLAPQYRALYRQIVFTAAWQESCWRQFIKKGDALTPLASATGDLGLMQVNRNTWRGLYDLKGLSGDIEYNSNAGSEILLYYLSRFAIRKREDRQPGGHLARATYSAYNGGPGQLGRYRKVGTPPVWKKVDEAFWTKFRAVSAGQELVAVKSCYAQ
jgi:transglycosylase-like protein with SLT domain